MKPLSLLPPLSSSPPPGSDHRTSSVAELRRRAREHSAALLHGLQGLQGLQSLQGLQGLRLPLGLPLPPLGALHGLHRPIEEDRPQQPASPIPGDKSPNNVGKDSDWENLILVGNRSIVAMLYLISMFFSIVYFNIRYKWKKIVCRKPNRFS